MQAIDKKEISRIVVRMPNWLGDAVMALPVLDDLRKGFPEAEIHVLAVGAVAELVKAHPGLSRIIPFSRERGRLAHLINRPLVRQLASWNYDLGLLLTNSFSSALWFWSAGVKRRAGFSENGRNFLLNYPVKKAPGYENSHLVKTYQALLSNLHIPIQERSPKLHLLPEEVIRVNALFPHAGTRPLLGINPGAAYGSAKCWPKERFRQLVERFAMNDEITVAVFGDKVGKDLADHICQNTPANVINFAGKTSLRELMALINRCSLLLTNDSGPMHLAQALETPLLALFGPTNARATGPYNFGQIIHKKVDCSPCYRRTCPIDHRCMLSISVEEVYEEVSLLLATTAG